MGKAIWWIDRISTWVGIPVCWLVIPLMLVTTWDVNLRYFFNAPTQWAYDVTYMLYGTQFMLCGAYALAQSNHVRGDVFYRFWSVRTQATIDLIMFFVFFFPGIIALVWAGYYFAEMSWRFREASMLTPSGPPLYHFKTVIPVSGFFIALQGVAEVLRAIVARRTGRWPDRIQDVQEAL